MANLVLPEDKSFLKGWKTHIAGWAPVWAPLIVSLFGLFGIAVQESEVLAMFSDWVGVVEATDVALGVSVSAARGTPDKVKEWIGRK